MTANPSRPDWRLPQGVPRGLWEYAHDEALVGAHDETFSRNSPTEFDEVVLRQYLRPPGVLIDLGCGTGRLAIPLARSGLRTVGIDLSRPALAALSRLATAADLPIDLVQANLVDLAGVRDGSADYCISMYSTLGMIRGGANRLQALRHARRILKPGGTFVVHVHNRWYNLFQPQSRWWWMKNVLASMTRRDVEAGDKYYQYHGVPNFFLHVYTRGELLRELQDAGFRVERLIPLSIERREALRWPWLLGWLRAGGWIAICR